MFRVRWRTLLIAGVILFVPIGLMETIDASLLGGIEDAGEWASSTRGIVAVGALDTVGSVLGEVVFAGVVTASVMVERRGGGTALREMLAELSPVRLAARRRPLRPRRRRRPDRADRARSPVPRLVRAARLRSSRSSTPRSGAAFGRSRRLVRRRPWLVAAFVLPIVALDETLTNLAHGVSVDALGEGFAGRMGSGRAGRAPHIPAARPWRSSSSTSRSPTRNVARAWPRTRPRARRRSGPEASA